MTDNSDFFAEKEVLLFGETDYKEKLSTKVVFGSLSYSVQTAVKGADSAVVFCREKDFAAAKKIFAVILGEGKRAKIITLPKAPATDDVIILLNGASVMIAVGEEDVISFAKAVCARAGISLAVAYSSCRAFGAFSDKTPCGSEGKAPDYLLVSEEFYSLSTKQLMAETFGQVVSSLIDVIDYKVAVLKNAVPYDKVALNFLLDAANVALLNKKFTSDKEALLFASLKIAILKEVSRIFDYSAVEKTAEYLGEQFPFGERRYRAFKVLVGLYSLYLRSDISSLYITPDYLKASKEISEFLSLDECEVVKTLAKFQTDKDIEANAKLKGVARHAFLSDLDAISLKTNRIDEIYRYLYGGRKKLADILCEDMKKAIKATAYTTENNLLAMSRADGFSEYI